MSNYGDFKGKKKSSIQDNSETRKIQIGIYFYKIKPFWNKGPFHLGICNVCLH